MLRKERDARVPQVWGMSLCLIAHLPTKGGKQGKKWGWENKPPGDCDDSEAEPAWGSSTAGWGISGASPLSLINTQLMSRQGWRFPAGAGQTTPVLEQILSSHLRAGVSPSFISNNRESCDRALQPWLSPSPN